MKLMETSIPVNYGQVILKEANLDWDPNDTGKIYDIVIMSISDFLGMMKTKDAKIALAVKDLKGNFKMAGVVAYHPNENEDMPGNWSYELTFDEKDIEEATVFVSTDAQFQRVVGQTSFNLYGMKFLSPTYVSPMIEGAATVLINWLDTNAKESEEVVIEVPGYFTASVVVEGGEKIMSIVPDGAMKRLVKDDSALENA
jgi:hypothetical protein